MIKVVFSVSQFQLICINNSPQRVKYRCHVLFCKCDILLTYKLGIIKFEELNALYIYVASVKPHYDSIIALD